MKHIKNQEQFLNESLNENPTDYVDYKKTIQVLQDENPKFDLRINLDTKFKNSYKVGGYIRVKNI